MMQREAAKDVATYLESLAAGEPVPESPFALNVRAFHGRRVSMASRSFVTGDIGQLHGYDTGDML